jgi:hypothetical protein
LVGGIDLAMLVFLSVVFATPKVLDVE